MKKDGDRPKTATLTLVVNTDIAEDLRERAARMKNGQSLTSGEPIVHRSSKVRKNQAMLNLITAEILKRAEPRPNVLYLPEPKKRIIHRLLKDD